MAARECRTRWHQGDQRQGDHHDRLLLFFADTLPAADPDVRSGDAGSRMELVRLATLRQPSLHSLFRLFQEADGLAVFKVDDGDSDVARRVVELDLNGRAIGPDVGRGVTDEACGGHGPALV